MKEKSYQIKSESKIMGGRSVKGVSTREFFCHRKYMGGISVSDKARKKMKKEKINMWEVHLSGIFVKE